MNRFVQGSYSFEFFKFHDFPWLFPWPFPVFHDLMLSCHFQKFSKPYSCTCFSIHLYSFYFYLINSSTETNSAIHQKGMSFTLFNNSSSSCVILVLSSAVTNLPNKTLIFYDFQGPTIKFHDFPGLENEILKFHDFPGFPWPVQTRLCTITDSTYSTRKYCYCCKQLHYSFHLFSNRDSQI